MGEATSPPELVSMRAGRRAGSISAVALALLSFNGPMAFAQEPPVGDPYVEQGPAELRNGQAEGMTNNPVVGAVEAAAAHPTLNTLWIGAINGGIWRTLDATAASPVWVNQTVALGSLSIGAVELDPTDGTSNTLMAGIDRRSSFGSTGGARPGVMRTTDGGANWAVVGNLANKGISGVAPRGTTVVASVRTATPLTCADIGIFRSTDSGGTFTQVAGGLPCGAALDLASDPVNNGAATSQLFAVIALGGALGGINQGIYRSNDTGATWTKVSNAAMDAIIGAGTFTRGEIAVGRQGPGVPGNANVATALCQSGRLSGLFYSPDGGTTWNTLTLPTTNDSTPIGIHPGGQCSVHLSITMDPVNHNIFYIGGDRQPWSTESVGGPVSFPNAVGADNFTGRLYRINGVANTFSPITHCVTGAPSGCGGAQRTTSDSAPHADSRDMVFLANGHLIETDDGGVYRHTNPNGVGDWVSAIGSLPVEEQHDGSYDTVSNIVMSGNQDTGSGQQITSLGLTWDTLNQGDGGDTAVGVNDPAAGQSTRYSSAQSFLGRIRRRFDSSNNFLGSTNLAFAATPACTGQFVTPLAVNTQNPARLVVGCGNGVYESTDRGDTATRQALNVVNFQINGGGPAIAYGVTGNADALYYGSGSQVFIRTAPPPAVPAGSSPGGGVVVAVAIDSSSAANGFALSTTTVSMTTTTGGAWSNITGNLFTLAPGTVLRSMAFVEGALGVDGLVVGTNNGTFIARSDSTPTAFATWQPLGTGLPNVPVFDLQYDPVDDVLLATTLGRGSWQLSGLQDTVPVELMWIQVD